MGTGESESFGQMLRCCRESIPYTQEELAERAQVAVKQIYNLESGNNLPQPGTLRRLTDALGLDRATRGRWRQAVDRAVSAARAAKIASIVPRPPTSLVGRAHELGVVDDSLRRPDDQLVTITGPGGVGKTHLALEAASNAINAFANGVFFVPLDALADERLVLSEIARAVGVQESAGIPIDERLRRFLRDKHVLLVLDNFEHVMGACRDIGGLLETCHHLTILITSRVALGMRAEHRVGIAPLACPQMGHVPPLEELAAYPAIALFVTRAQAVNATFGLTTANAIDIAGICDHVEGLPLALELAAMWMDIMTPASLLAKLRQSPLEVLSRGPSDLPQRQRALSDTFEVSYRQLTPSQQTLFRRLGVFGGTWASDAARTVCGTDLTIDVPATLGQLARASLARVELQTDAAPETGETRFRMLRMVREYALDKLRANHEVTAMQRRLALWCRDLVRQAESNLTGPLQEEWLTRLEAERDNVRAALHWTRLNREIELGLQVAGALWRFWQARGYVTEGRRWLEELLNLMAGSSDIDVSMQAKALNAAGMLALYQGDYARAASLHESCLTLRRQLGQAADIAASLNNLGLVAYKQGNYDQATTLHEQSLIHYRDLGDKTAIARSLNNLAVVLDYLGDYGYATALHEESLTLRRELSHKTGIAGSLGNLGSVAYRQGDYGRAVAYAQESLALYQELNSQTGMATALEILGLVAYKQSDYDRATAILNESLALFRDVEEKDGICSVLNGLGAIARTQGDYGKARAWLRESLIVSEEIGAKLRLAECIEGLAQLACAQGQYQRSARLFGAVASLRSATRAPLADCDRTIVDQSVATTRTALGDIAFMEAWQEGQAMSLVDLTRASRAEEDTA